MSDLRAFAFISLIAAMSSCSLNHNKGDNLAVFYKTSSPFEKSFSLSGDQLTAATEGRLGVRVRAAADDSGSFVPVQWKINKTGDAAEAILMIPSGEAYDWKIDLSEKKTAYPAAMQASEDAVSGQINITDDGKPVLRYNYRTVFEKDALDTLPANKYAKQATDTFMANPSIYAVPRSNYIHPVYGPSGELLTRDWSKDHPHHRGIYWAWPEVGFGSRMGDLHALQIVFARPTGNIRLENGPVFAQVEAENNWMWGDTVAIVREVAVIRAYRSTPAGRVIDLSFRFEALKDSISIARRETHLYGGLNIRMHTPEKQEISSSLDPSFRKPRRAWSDLSGLFTGASSESGMLVLQHNQNPDYPGDYIQYPDLAWIQPGFPAAKTRYRLLPGKPLVLHYRIFVHPGMKPGQDVSAMLWDAYNNASAPLPSFSFPETGEVKR